MTSSDDTALVAAADELYALPAEEFTAARNAKIKTARAAGDRDLAAAIQRLARPSAAAALANLLVRRDEAAFEPLLELGVALRQATAALDGAQLRALSRQQQQVVTGLVAQARVVAKDAGLKVSPATLNELDDTLRAAIADAGAAEQLMTGRLTGPLQHSGFGPTPTGHLTVVPDRPVAEPKASDRKASDRKAVAEPKPAAARAADRKADDRAAARRADASAAVAKAEAALEDAVTARRHANGRLTELEESVGELRSRVERLRADLAEAQRQHTTAERDKTKAKDALTKASQTMRAAARRLEDATARLEDLD